LTDIRREPFVNVYFGMLEETFEKVHGMYLDKYTSLFETLDTISAEVASRPVSASCATLAAQVEHLRVYLDNSENILLGKDGDGVDWGEVWRTVSAVTPAEWEASKGRLKASYNRLSGLFKNLEHWDTEEKIYAALSSMVHSAYHLGEIRQALCTLMPER
jgi:hypothetical protein